MRLLILIWALPVGLADILCDVRMSERQVMLINTKTGDEKYTASTLELQCNDVFKRNDTTVRVPWKLWMKSCMGSLMYDKHTDSCGGCPDMMGDSVQEHFPDAPEDAYWEGCQPIEATDGKKCSCRYAYFDWRDDGHQHHVWKNGVIPMKVGCKASDDGCMMYLSSREAWQGNAHGIKMPSYTCTDLPAFAPSADIGSAMLTPPLAKDSLFQLLRFQFADGVMKRSDVVKDWSMKENTVKILFMSRISRSGQAVLCSPWSVGQQLPDSSQHLL